MILVVEDDDWLQGIVEDTLIEAGFEPAITASGEEAVILLRSRLVRYRALVTDIALKGRMDGWMAAKHARVIDPTFPVIYITGAFPYQWVSQAVPDSILLAKPFAPTALVATVRHLLNGGSPT